MLHFTILSFYVYLYLILIFIISNYIVHSTNNDELCRNNRHIVGNWIKYDRKKPQSKAFYCCGILDYDYKWNNSICHQIKTISNKWDFQGSVLADDRACNQEKLRNERINVSLIESYIWEPLFCNIIPWDGIQFCNLLGNRTILLVGDSTLGQSATTLMSMISHSGGTCGPQIRYYRSNFLYFTEMGLLSLKDIALKNKPDICIFTAGAHLEDMGDIYSVWNNLIQSHIPIILKSLPNIKLIWKSQNPADDNCMNIQEPRKHYPKIHDIPLSQWGHHLYRRFDSISLKYTNKLRISYMDMAPLYMRGDAHVGHFMNEKGVAINDCLHYAVPGPLNLFSELLLQMLYTKET